MNNIPEKALLLAAGFGKRLRPLTTAMPKPLLPLWGKPLIDRIVDLLVKHGVKEVVVNAHWHAQLLKEHVESAGYGLKVHFSPESSIRGTGGALRPWRDFFSDEPFLVINGDIAASLDLKLLVDAYTSLPGLIGVCWVSGSKGPRTVECDFAGRITCYRSPDPGIDGTFTFCGAQLLSPAVFDFIPDKEFSTLIDAYENAMTANLFVKGVDPDESYWNDAGTLTRYLAIHKETKKLAISGKPGGELYDPGLDLLKDRKYDFFAVGPEVKLEEGVKGSDSVVYDNVTLNKTTSLKNAVIQSGVIGGSVNKVSCIGGAYLKNVRITDAAEAIGWDLQKSAFSFIGLRGSDRSFWRGYNGESRAIFILDNGGRPENLHYASHTEFLRKAGVAVPELFYVSDDRRQVVIEDMGSTSLADKTNTNPDNVEKTYSSVLKEVAQFHRSATKKAVLENYSLEPGFDRDLYRWEHELFEKELLQKRFGFESLTEDVADELEMVAESLLAGSKCVIHRDLQSSNILFKDRRFAFIDYQGMRSGSPAYDIASLLYDPYVTIDTKLRCKLAAEYATLMPGLPDVLPLFFKGAVQRLVQSLGAFGRLSKLGHSSFENSILPGLENLLEAADAADLDALGGLTEELIARETIRVESTSVLKK